VPATARPLTSEETAAALTAYARAHPRAWAVLRPVFETTLGTRIDNGGASLPVIALDLAAGHPGQLAPPAPRQCGEPVAGLLAAAGRQGAGECDRVVSRPGVPRLP
jgi:hypothetical protein